MCAENIFFNVKKYILDKDQTNYLDCVCRERVSQRAISM